jgi:hypothetical protein
MWATGLWSTICLSESGLGGLRSQAETERDWVGLPL